MALGGISKLRRDLQRSLHNFKQHREGLVLINKKLNYRTLKINLEPMILNKMKILAIRVILIYRSETFIVIIFIYAEVLLLLL